jgi:hypothetical protein
VEERRRSGLWVWSGLFFREWGDCTDDAMSMMNVVMRQGICDEGSDWTTRCYGLS